MERRAHITNATPLPTTITRAAALAFLHDHVEMIELNPLVIRHRLTTAPPNATPEEQEKCTWYEITDVINYLPGGLAKSEVSYKGGFYDTPDGLQTHVFAPAGVDLKGRWKIGGNMPGEPPVPSELGLDVPREGLYLREETELRCNIFLMSFVKKNLKKSHGVLVQDLIAKANDPKYQSTAGHKAAKSPSLGQSGNAAVSVVLSPASRTASVPSSDLQHVDQACSCQGDGHRVMCPNYRYVPSIAVSSPEELRKLSQKPKPLSKTVATSAESTSTLSSYHSTQQYPYRPMGPSDRNKPLPAGPPGSSGSVARYTSPQLYGEQAELPSSPPQTATEVRSQRHSGPPTSAELDGSSAAYRRQQQSPG